MRSQAPLYAQVARYSEPDNKHYRNLYLFNIMPSQIKRRSDALAAEQSDLVYANSGLFSIETEIETFAGKYAAYNKCFQSQLFLRKVILITEEEIEREKANCEEIRQSIRDKLEADKKTLIERLEAASSQEQERSESEYQEYMSEYLSQTEGTFSVETLKEREAAFNKAQEERQAYSDRERAVKDAKGAVVDNLLGAFRDQKITFSTVRAAAQGLAADVSTVRDKTKTQRETRKDVDRAVADDLLKYSSDLFYEKLSEFYTLLHDQSKQYWTKCTETTVKSRKTVIEMEVRL